jgi:hypothetical protein
MTQPSLAEEAESCRRRALAYVGRPEAPILLRIAEEFDRLAHERRFVPVQTKR